MSTCILTVWGQTLSRVNVRKRSRVIGYRNRPGYRTSGGRPRRRHLVVGAASEDDPIEPPIASSGRRMPIGFLLHSTHVPFGPSACDERRRSVVLEPSLVGVVWRERDLLRLLGFPLADAIRPKKECDRQFLRGERG